MIIGIGSDIVQIPRVQRLYTQFQARFLDKCFHPSEIETFHTLSENKQISFLAKRFAAKEAVAKAFGTGFDGNVKLNQIYVVNSKSGKPEIRLDGETAVFFEAMHQGPKKLHLSLSDEITYAIAFVVIEAF